MIRMGITLTRRPTCGDDDVLNPRHHDVDWPLDAGRFKGAVASLVLEAHVG